MRLNEEQNAPPEGWCWATLADIVINPKSDIVDGPFGSNLKASEYVTSGVPIVRIQNVDRNRFLDKNIRFISNDKAEELKRHNFQPGDIVITKLGDPLGKACIVPEDFDPGIIVADIVRLRLYHDLCSLPYLMYAINSDISVEQLLGDVKGTTRPRVNLGHIRLLKVPLAPLNEQKRIVAKVEELLARVNAARERLAKVQEIMKRFRQSVLSAACSGRLSADWRENNSDVEPALGLLKRIQKERKKRYEEECAKAKLEGKRKPKKPDGMEIPDIDETNLPEIPESWRWAHLQNLGELSRGKSKHRPRNAPKLFGGKYSFIQTGDVARSNRFVTSHLQTYNEIGLAQSRLFPENTLCITIAANIGDTAILTYPACFPDSVVGFIPEQGFFEVLFAMYYIRTVQSDLQTFAPATAQMNINLEILHKVAVPVPPLAEQKEIVRRVEGLFKTADRIQESYEKAKSHVDKLTQSILAKAFRGELVPQDPNDEAASTLLKRIRAEQVKGQVETERRRARKRNPR